MSGAAGVKAQIKKARSGTEDDGVQPAGSGRKTENLTEKQILLAGRIVSDGSIRNNSRSRLAPVSSELRVQREAGRS